MLGPVLLEVVAAFLNGLEVALDSVLLLLCGVALCWVAFGIRVDLGMRRSRARAARLERAMARRAARLVEG